ncbi:hypothetical protein [Falsiroseomonas sp. HW251]|uniref:hypothetical protein n=1 Tax=Falsiroseomonas sp. HW251 TaxID=3390998 RepID=UPI003D319BC5
MSGKHPPPDKPSASWQCHEPPQRRRGATSPSPAVAGEGWGGGQDTIPPYRAQWESADLVAEFLAGRSPATDPLWRHSGAETPDEYALWAEHLCGCACLQMAVGARGLPIPPIHAIRRGVQDVGGYVVQPDGTIRGLVYAGAVAWLAGQGIAAEILLDRTASDIPALLAGGALLIASVHGAIRWPDRPAPGRGGHLVLCFGTAPDGAIRFHNPSGDTPASRRDARLAPAVFDRFFAGRGILLR